ncbi:putative pseudouridine transporter isoform X5 [Dermacentor albipictus]|uniref:putative pseudouridine transporter isoform X5 n=1 Tax=Dermacentor albipictus TaxID=60249 RepID=UPI0031FCE8C3
MRRRRKNSRKRRDDHTSSALSGLEESQARTEDVATHYDEARPPSELSNVKPGKKELSHRGSVNTTVNSRPASDGTTFSEHPAPAASCPPAVAPPLQGTREPAIARPPRTSPRIPPLQPPGSTPSAARDAGLPPQMAAASDMASYTRASSKMAGEGSGPQGTELCYDTEQPPEYLSDIYGLPRQGVIKRTGAPSPEMLDGARRWLYRSVTWLLWLLVHAYAVWLAWRIWAQHQPTSALAGGSCGDVFLVAAVLAAVNVGAGATVLRGTKAWLAAEEAAEAASHMASTGLQAVSFLKPAMGFPQEGAKVVLGYLVNGEMNIPEVVVPLGFAFSVLPDVLFLGFVVIVLFYYGVLQQVVVKVGWLAHHLLGLTCCEAVVAMASIFLGVAEAPLLVLPYVERLTRSELHCIMTICLTTVSSTVLPVYTNLGLSPDELITASLLSKVAGIVSSKLLCPETQLSITAHYNIDHYESPERSAVHAVAAGMVTVLAMASSTAWSLVTFLSAEACLDEVCKTMSKLVFLPELTPHVVLTWLLKPLVLLMGIQEAEVHSAADLLAASVLDNDVVALMQHAANGPLSVRTRHVLTSALCGSANVGSAAVVLGTLSGMAPGRAGDVTSLLLGTLVAACAANLLVAYTVGTLITNTVNPALAEFEALGFFDG